MKKALISPESLELYYWSSDPHIHPAGDKVAYVRKQMDMEQNAYFTHIRTVSIDGVQDAPLSSGSTDTQPLWSPDGKQLGFLRAIAGVNQLWLVAADGTDERAIVQPKHSISEWQWLPDGSGLVYVTRVHLHKGLESLSVAAWSQRVSRQGASYTTDMPKAEGRGWWDGLYSQLFHYDLASGTVKQLTAGAFHASQPRVLDSGRIAFIARQEKGDRAESEVRQGLYVLEEGNKPRQLVSGAYEIAQYDWSDDGDAIVFIGHDRAYGSATHNRLYRVGLLEGGEPQPICSEDVQLGVYVLNDMTAGASAPGPFIKGNGDAEAVYALVSKHGEVQIWKWKQGQPGQQLTSKPWVIHQLAASKAAEAFVVNAIDSKGPGELYAIEPDSGEIRKLTRWNDSFCQQHAIAEPQPLSFTNSAGAHMQGWLLLPPAQSLLQSASQSIPLILAIHGGPHAMYTPAFAHEFQALASQGYALLFCNPRGSFGYGQQFAAGCLKDAGKGDYDDLMLAVDETLERFAVLNKQRLGVMGGSYGGLMTNWIIGQTNRFQAAVSQRSISNWLSFYGNSDIGARYTEAMLGGNPWDNYELLWQRSPVAYANKVETPVLIMHGEQDMRCPIEQSDQWYANLKRWGKEAKLVRYAGSNHAFQKAGKPSLRVDVLQQVNAWFYTHLRKPVTLGIPFAMLLENCRSSGASDEVIAACIASKDFSAIAHLAKEPDMPFVERVELAEEMNINWQDVFQYGYCFSFLHANALKRLLLFRYGLRENVHYTQQEYNLLNVPLSEEQAVQLQALIGRQWKVERTEQGWLIKLAQKALI